VSVYDFPIGFFSCHYGMTASTWAEPKYIMHNPLRIRND